MSTTEDQKQSNKDRLTPWLDNLGALMFWICLVGFVFLLLAAILHLLYPL